MGLPLVMGAMLQCSFGAAPSSLVVTPKNRVICCNMPAANIMDNIPFCNIMPFGVCTSMANPAVAAATAAALGVLTPMPCTPVIPGPWIPGAPTDLTAVMPTPTNDSKLFCAFAGVIQVTTPGQFTTMTG